MGEQRITHLKNTTKLNYLSCMNKQSRAKWSKSDSDLFNYQARNNLYLKQVIKKNLNIKDLPIDVNSTRKTRAASNGGNSGNENVLEDSINHVEENGLNCWSKAQAGHRRIRCQGSGGPCFCKW
ncbi:hypothetical protein BRADI_4g16196v3 [Brachypodium distachyon]|uniref:Uncharacterized protein n=1 Tax=Brachypodium distachyon TaxID=15368 RepID=A0A0Q3H411_BRADI|nr:hypothetical protein BRADI_4g16196v3 [Brachypodium distachyon]